MHLDVGSNEVIEKRCIVVTGAESGIGAACAAAFGALGDRVAVLYHNDADLAAEAVMSQALVTLKGRARVKRTMWSRRAQEYEAKINSGCLVSLAEVVRDLYRSDSQPEQSYSERQLYESALDRMAREVAAIEKIDRDAAVALLNKNLTKAA